MANTDAMKGLKYGGIAAAGVLGVYLLYKTINIATNPKVHSALSTAYSHPAALSDIIIHKKRYNTKREVQDGGSRKHKNKTQRSTKNKK
jgi:hypothetical protein